MCNKRHILFTVIHLARTATWFPYRDIQKTFYYDFDPEDEYFRIWWHRKRLIICSVFRSWFVNDHPLHRQRSVTRQFRDRIRTIFFNEEKKEKNQNGSRRLILSFAVKVEEKHKGNVTSTNLHRSLIVPSGNAAPTR